VISRFIENPFVWLGLAAGCVVGVLIAVCLWWWSPHRHSGLLYASVVGACLLIGVTAFLRVEAHLLESVKASVQQQPPSESLTATATYFEFRSQRYASSEALLVGLRGAQPRPEYLNVTWFAVGNTPAEWEAANANAALAQATAREAGIRVSERPPIGVARVLPPAASASRQ